MAKITFVQEHVTIRPAHPDEVYVPKTVPEGGIIGYVTAINQALADAGARALHGTPLRVMHPIWTPRHRVHPNAQLMALDRFLEHWNVVAGKAVDGSSTWLDFTPRGQMP